MIAPRIPVNTTNPAVNEGNPPICSEIPIAIGVVTDLGIKERIASSEAPIACAIKIAAKIAVAELAIRAASIGIAALRTLGKFATSGMARETVAGPRRK